LHRIFFSRFVVLILTGVSLYSVSGFLLAPRLVKNWIEATVAEHSEKRLRVQEVTFNPYTFLLTLTDALLHEADDGRLLTIPAVVTRVDLTKIVARTLVFRDVELRDVAMTTPAGGHIFVAPRLNASSIEFDMSRQAATVAELRLEKPRLRIEHDPTGRLDLPGWLVRLAIDPATAMITIRSTEIADARASYVDRRTTPNVLLESESINGTIVRLDGGSAMTVDLDFKGRLLESGSGTIVTRWRASSPHNAAHVELTLNDLNLAIISPYVRELTGRGIRAGRLDLALRYDYNEGKPATESRVTVNNLRLGENVGTDTRASWPLELAVALLEDNFGQIDITLPVQSNTPEPAPTIAARVTAPLHDLVVGLAANPFREMAVLADLPDVPLDHVPFVTGSAELTPPTLTRVAALSAALAARPRLGLTTFPAYDPVIDRHALAAQQVRLHVALATSAGPPGRAVEKPMDFDDLKVRAVLDEFSAARLSASRRAAISGRFAEHDQAFYRAVFEALVENETVSATALERLANYRAQSFVNALATAGIPSARLVLSDVIEAVAGDNQTINLRLEAMALDATRPEPNN